MISPRFLGEVARACRERLEGCDSPRSALAAVASCVSIAIGPRPGRAVLERPGPVSSAFLELLDQIVFEMDESRELEGGRVEEYILGDLYRRLEIFLSLCAGADSYRESLNSRVLTADDALIIRHYALSDLVAPLMSEFFEQPHIRFPVLLAMVSFESEDLVGFLYEIARGEYDTDLRVLAVIGLNMNNYGRFDGWDMLSGTGDEDFRALIRYVSGGTDADSPTGCILLFRVLEVEFEANRIAEPEDCAAVLSSLHGILKHELEAMPMKPRIYESLSRILDQMRCGAMRRHLRDDDNLRDFIYLVDGMPAELFERVSRLMEYLGGETMTAMERLVAGGGVHLDERSSQLSAYLMSQGYDPLLL
jgi:hypothetical protein